LLAVFQMCHLF